MTAVHWWRCPCCQFITATCLTEKAAAAARDAHLGTAEHPAAAVAKSQPLADVSLFRDIMRKGKDDPSNDRHIPASDFLHFR